MSQAEERTVRKDGYEVTFYPGFASRCTVKNGEGEIELYRQEESYRLPNGQTEPRRNYRLAFRGGKRKQDVTLRVDDPERRIKSITVELYPETHGSGTRSTSEDVETFSVANDAVTCPPEC
jgi:hypothetical protein